MGSFLLTSPLSSSWARAASLGCTSTTRSPAATSCWATKYPRPEAFSTAQVRSGHALAHSLKRASCSGPDRTRNWPSVASCSSMATAVCEPLCGSMPIVTAMKTSFGHWGSWTVAGTSDFRDSGARASFQPRHDEARRVGTPFGSQASSGRQTVNEPAHRTSRTLWPKRSALVDTQSDGYRISNVRYPRLSQGIPAHRRALHNGSLPKRP